MDAGGVQAIGLGEQGTHGDALIAPPVDADHLPELAAVDAPLDGRATGVEAQDMADHELAPQLLSQRNHLPGLGEVVAERLFHEHVHSCPERRHHRLEVSVVIGDHMYGVELHRLQHLGNAGEDVRYAVAFGQLAGTCTGPGDEGDHFDAIEAREHIEMSGPEVAQTDDGKTCRVHVDTFFRSGGGGEQWVWRRRRLRRTGRIRQEGGVGLHGFDAPRRRTPRTEPAVRWIVGGQTCRPSQPREPIARLRQLLAQQCPTALESAPVSVLDGQVHHLPRVCLEVEELLTVAPTVIEHVLVPPGDQCPPLGIVSSATIEQCLDAQGVAPDAGLGGHQ